MPVTEARMPKRLLVNLSESSRTLPILVSLALVIPCFWQSIVASGDLQSHLYNAWLADLIRSGSIHGLWIGHQSTNLVIDLTLSWLLKTFGVAAAERITTSCLVLIFFWGAFRFVSAVRGRPAYWLMPWLAILSYGFVFQLGLLNYYLSCGIVLWVLALVWERPFGWRLLWSAPLLLIAYLAHPLPVLWLLGIATYCWLAARLRPGMRIALFVGSALLICGIRDYLVAKAQTIWMIRQSFFWTGVDQALVYGWPYLVVAAAFLLFVIILLSQPENRWAALASVPAQAYFLTALAIVVIPWSIRGSSDHAWASHIGDRLSLLSAVLLLAILGRSIDRKWYLPVGLATAAVFFCALYGDIRREAQMERKVQELVHTLPTGSRVVSFADLLGGADPRSSIGQRHPGPAEAFVISAFLDRMVPTHLLSRACLGHCFDYGNYEPSTGQFRIHALPGNHVVIARWADFNEMVLETYAVKADELPLYGLIRCGPNPADLVLRPFGRGETGAMLTCSGTATQR